jgi:hypothetical protein
MATLPVRSEKSTGTPKPRRFPGRQEGVILIAVLWICALIMWFALRIGVETHFQGEEQINQFRKSQALHLAVGGCFEAIARMGMPRQATGLDKKDEDSWEPDGQPHVVEYQTGQAMVMVEAEQNKVNVNKANAQQIKLVLEKTGMEGNDASNLAETIVGFVSTSKASGLHGTAGKGLYEQMGLPYGPFNGPLTSLDQMLLIPGITQQVFYGYGRTDEEVEENESGIVKSPLFPRKDSLFSLFTIYGTNVTLAQSDALVEKQEKQLTWAAGGVYRILSCGAASSGSPAVVIWLVVRLSPEGERGYQVLYRKIL